MHHERDSQAERELNRNGDQQDQGGNPQSLPEDRIGDQAGVVANPVEADRLGERRLLETDEHRVDEGDDPHDRQDEHRRCDHQVGEPFPLQHVADAPSRSETADLCRHQSALSRLVPIQLSARFTCFLSISPPTTDSRRSRWLSYPPWRPASDSCALAPSSASWNRWSIGSWNSGNSLIERRGMPHRHAAGDRRKEIRPGSLRVQWVAERGRQDRVEPTHPFVHNLLQPRVLRLLADHPLQE